MRGALIGSVLVAALGGLLFGFDTAVISGTTDWLKQEFVLEMTGQTRSFLPGLCAPFAEETLANFLLGFTVASALIGTIIGSIAVGRPADTLGRRAVLIILAVFYFVSALGSAWAWDGWSFSLFRWLGGLAVGGASVVSPMYIAEISPAKYRGRLVAITQFNIVFGILLAYLSNYVIAGLQIGATECRWMYGVEAVPAAAFFFLLFFTPQSPRWLVAQGRVAEARGVLERCGADLGNVDQELQEIQASLDLAHHTLHEPFYCAKYARPILLAVAIAAFNQLSGINALIYYTAHIFKMAGFGAADALLQSVIIGLTNLVFTMAAMAVIDHIGRKRLMLVGSIGYIVSLSAAAYAFFELQALPNAVQAAQQASDARPAGMESGGLMGTLLMASLVVFIAAHAFGQGAVIWVFISEVFPNRVRARGQALGSFTHWVMAAAISWTFPLIAARAGWMAFAFYALCSVGQLFWVLLVMPETKGVSLEKIQQELGIE